MLDTAMISIVIKNSIFNQRIELTNVPLISELVVAVLYFLTLFLRLLFPSFSTRKRLETNLASQRQPVWKDMKDGNIFLEHVSNIHKIRLVI